MYTFQAVYYSVPFGNPNGIPCTPGNANSTFSKTMSGILWRWCKSNLCWTTTVMQGQKLPFKACITSLESTTVKARINMILWRSVKSTIHQNSASTVNDITCIDIGLSQEVWRLAMLHLQAFPCTVASKNVKLWPSLRKQGMWAHDICLPFQSFWTHNFLSQHAMSMKFSALSTNVLGIRMQVTEQKYSVSVLRYDL